MYELRPYQVEAIAEIERAWESGHRSTILVLATGLGKTTVFTEIARRARDARRGRTLVLAHRIELVEQAAARLEVGTLTTEIESGDRRASWMQLPVSDAVVATVQTLRGRRLARWPRDAFGTIVIDEALQDAVTAVSGSGPAYFFAFVEAMVKAGEGLGLSHEEASTLAIATIKGAAAMLESSGKSATTLRENVTSPHGTTAAALRVLSENDLERIVREAMTAARNRSLELG